MSNNARLQLGNESFDLPIVVGSEEEQAVDIRALRAQSGYIILDDGYGNIGACESAITFIDGEKGILRYRGFPIEQLAQHSSFIETAHLLIWGELPSTSQLRMFREQLTKHMALHEDIRHHFDLFPTDSPPMAVLSAVLNALSCFHPEFLQIEDESGFAEGVARIMAKVRTIAAYSYRHAMGLPEKMFTVIFAIGRMPGWIAHWYEGQFLNKSRINRPRQIYTGSTERDYVPLGDR